MAVVKLYQTDKPNKLSQKLEKCLTGNIKPTNIAKHSAQEVKSDNVGSLSSALQDKEDTQVTKNKSISSTSQVQEDNQLALQTLANTLSPLVDVLSAPILAHIMETSPSNIINKEVQKTSNVDPLTTLFQASEFESPSRFTVLDDADEAENEQPRSLSLTRGGRETKPPIKYQDLEWKTVQGRGKHGRRGRGSTR